MEFAEVQAFIDANKETEEVKGYLAGLTKVTPEGVTAFLDTDEGKKIVQPRLDSHFTKGLETWKEKTFPELLEAEIKKRFPDETDEQKRVRKLEEDLASEKNARLRGELTNKAIKQATEKGLPLDIVEHFVGADEAVTLANLTKLETVWQAAIEAAVEAKFKESGRDPHKETDPHKYKGKNPWAADSFNLTKQAELVKSDPELAKQLKAAAGF